MKAIHNKGVQITKSNLTVFNISKIQNESNSQPESQVTSFSINCFQYFKDTK